MKLLNRIFRFFFVVESGRCGYCNEVQVHNIYPRIFRPKPNTNFIEGFELICEQCEQEMAQ